MSVQVRRRPPSASKSSSCASASSAEPRFLGSGGGSRGQLRRNGPHGLSPSPRCCSTHTASCTFHGSEAHHSGGSPGSEAPPSSSWSVNVALRGTWRSTAPTAAASVATSPRTPFGSAPTATRSRPPLSASQENTSVLLATVVVGGDRGTERAATSVRPAAQKGLRIIPHVAPTRGVQRDNPTILSYLIKPGRCSTLCCCVARSSVKAPEPRPGGQGGIFS